MHCLVASCANLLLTLWDWKAVTIGVGHNVVAAVLTNILCIHPLFFVFITAVMAIVLVKRWQF